MVDLTKGIGSVTHLTSGDRTGAAKNVKRADDAEAAKAAEKSRRDVSAEKLTEQQAEDTARETRRTLENTSQALGGAQSFDDLV